MPELKVSQLVLNANPPTSASLLLANGGVSEQTSIQNAVDAAMPQTPHANDTNNPHGVTFTQVGAEQANPNIQAHIADTTGNPHGITPNMIGAEPALGFVPIDSALMGAFNGVATLGSNGKLVQMPSPADIGGAANRSLATTAQATAGTDNATVMTPLRVKEAFTSYGGKVLQVVSKTITTQGSQTIPINTDVPVGVGTDFALTITPKANGSRFLIKYRWFGEMTSSENKVFNIQRDGVRVNETTGLFDAGLAMATQSYGGATNDSSTPEILTLETLDASGSTAGTATTFQLVISDATGNNQTMWTNRCFGGLAGAASMESGVSEVTIMEIAA